MGRGLAVAAPVRERAALRGLIQRAALVVSNSPNPFNPETGIDFQVLRPGAVRLEVFDLQGRLVRTLQDGALGAGTYRRVFDGRDEAGAPLASGVYVYRLQAGGGEESRRMLLLK